ncbi:hypothetical protein BRE01_66930 [Brevibacillus reuszeri]|uniref:Uncharacterized protein n=1 Tax=Brevibacillus reuszeri TaxID=54915 RepID=A0A0K9YP26_9BACL|nr:hypothetical protein [Brevibacillus reuszeri]KNB70479.1 hypothetical protein ADS79_16280 [Brevibacillus reuszeri]MED1861810.1 hypothetical protein [Brevibacillus reuszeri]GED72991.1 hypothetical protein BRE01_66930 [Brevibacillus reuszeri]
MGLVNKIEVESLKSAHCEAEHHTIVIDGTPLDLLLHSQYTSDNLLGMIPTIIDWVDEPKEKEFLKKRFNSEDKEVILPVLMCPDDCDLLCTVIVANVVKTDEYIIWKQVGIDRSNEEFRQLGYDGIGTTVDWLEKIPPMTFENTIYISQLRKIYD